MVRDEHRIGLEIAKADFAAARHFRHVFPVVFCLPRSSDVQGPVTVAHAIVIRSIAMLLALQV